MVPLLLGTHPHQLPPPQLLKLVGLRIHFFVVGLVRHAENGQIQAPQSPGHDLVQLGCTGLRVDDKQDHVGGIDPDCDLVLDLLAQIIHVIDTDTPGINNFKVHLLVLQEVRHPVAGDPGRVVDNCNAVPREPVENARFADIRATDNNYLWNGHDQSMISVEVGLINGTDGDWAGGFANRPDDPYTLSPSCE